MYFLDYEQNGNKLTFCITDDNEIKFLQCVCSNKIDSRKIDISDFKWYRLVEVHISGGDQNDHHFSKHTGSSESFSLKYIKNEEIFISGGKIFYIEQQNAKINVKTYFQFYDNVKAFRTWNEVTNISGSDIILEHVSSFNFVGLNMFCGENWQDCINVYMPNNYWLGECQWTKHNVKELGLFNVGAFSGKRILASNTGTWSTQECLPMGMIENTTNNEFLLWQIESSSSWCWEISTMSDTLYLMANGPTYTENNWIKQLKPGENFKTINVSVAIGNSSEDVIAYITDYRRAIRRKNSDNVNLPVIFNDYMNCLNADPTTEKEIPLINKAAELGCEYYCIDAGWYSSGYWWDNVGEWLPCESRFNGSLVNLLDYIRDKGMVPGLWLEIEVMGINCPVAKNFPDECFFMRNGKRVIDHSRYQLDFSNAKVKEYADSVIKRLVEEYKIGYIKMDYNINAGAGTEVDSISVGDGLLKHIRAYTYWLENVFKKYPHLVIENCASGGCRMDYGMLSQLSIQSTSDQTDYKKYAVIASNCCSAVTPEQAAVWSYPLTVGDEEETAFNMINCILLRIHQSGHIANIDSSRYALIEEGIKLYKNIRKNIPKSYPVWPMGLNSPTAEVMCFGLKITGKIYLAVWQMSENKISIDLSKYGAKETRLLYPLKLKTEYSFDKTKGELNINLCKYTARLFEIKI